MESIMNKEYKAGQLITLDNGYTGRVKYVCTFGNKDIRPPYHLTGVPQLEGVNGYLGFLTVIPDNWEKLYSNEVHESEIINN